MKFGEVNVDALKKDFPAWPFIIIIAAVLVVIAFFVWVPEAWRATFYDQWLVFLLIGAFVGIVTYYSKNKNSALAIVAGLLAVALIFAGMQYSSELKTSFDSGFDKIKETGSSLILNNPLEMLIDPFLPSQLKELQEDETQFDKVSEQTKIFVLKSSKIIKKIL